ncbi:DUF7657 domain-containing protein [Cellulomonas phragmiteti]|uniref:Glycosyltransferase RgtA/B/C/D-like domain-containing protein n=1 Tax=Cellulomonas phragmiteti TaxID=478780 RepID=A0ABQ4DJW4_9CELL|nr:hypothetical protein [Cellulomonas phragmiteti]GIG39633.1 hypothetical protein Cph01nite_13950 [Cellulomonas phragmiteti]
MHLESADPTLPPAGPAAPGATPGPAAAGGRTWRDVLRRHWHVVGPVAVYLLLVVLGVTLSSIGTWELRQDPAQPYGHQIGEPLALRSDEFLTSTPLNLGVTATGSTDDLNPLAAPHGFTSLLSSGPVSSVVLHDATLLRLGPWLPDASLLAARWWLPVLLLLLGAPAFFREVTGNRWVGWFAAGLMLASPATAWWSLGPVTMLGYTLAGAAALLLCARRWTQDRRAVAVAYGLTAAVLLARTPFHYQPWTIVVVLPLLVAAVLTVLRDRETRRTGLVVTAAVGGGALALAGAVLAENWASFQAITSTLYPGARVVTGESQPLQEVFGATLLGWQEYLPITGTNNSEISSSFAVAAIWVLVLVASRAVAWRRVNRPAIAVLGAATVFWSSWVLVDWGVVGTHVPLANLVPPGRAADVLGYLAVALLCLLLPGLVERPGVVRAVVAGGAVTAVVGVAGLFLQRDNLLGLSSPRILLASVLTGLCVALVTWRPRAVVPYVVTVALAVTLVWRVNPVLVGLGDLRASSTAQQMMRDGAWLREHGQAWASDDVTVDALMLATGVPALSGRQLAGPDRAAWQRMLPGSDENVWNRGGSFVLFVWDDTVPLTVSNPAADRIEVRGPACEVATRMREMTSVVSSHRLDEPCLVEHDSFVWSGRTHWRYTVDLPDTAH